MSKPARQHLKSIVVALNSIEHARDNLSARRRKVMTRAKRLGFDLGALREVVLRRRGDAQSRTEREQTVTLYLKAIGSR